VQGLWAEDWARGVPSEGVRSAGWIRKLRSELNQSGLRRREAAGVEVEPFEIVIEVDVKPFASRCSCTITGHLDEHRAEAAATGIRCNHHVLDPCVSEPVRNDIHESDEGAMDPRGHPSEAVFFDQGPPIPLIVAEYPSVESLRV
jgi:hypothetical protein